MLDAETMRTLDDATEGVDVVEVYYWWGSDTRCSVGVYQGLEKDELGEWLIRRENRPDVRMIDVVRIRRLKPVGAGKKE